MKRPVLLQKSNQSVPGLTELSLFFFFAKNTRTQNYLIRLLVTDVLRTVSWKKCCSNLKIALKDTEYPVGVFIKKIRKDFPSKINAKYGARSSYGCLLKCNSDSLLTCMTKFWNDQIPHKFYPTNTVIFVMQTLSCALFFRCLKQLLEILFVRSVKPLHS